LRVFVLWINLKYPHQILDPIANCYGRQNLFMHSFFYIRDKEHTIEVKGDNFITSTWLQLPGAAHKSTTRFTPAIKWIMAQNGCLKLPLYMRNWLLSITITYIQDIGVHIQFFKQNRLMQVNKRGLPVNFFFLLVGWKL
jgi:hypothetical protein